MSRLPAVRRMPNDTPARTLGVAMAVSLVCAVIVSTTAVLLQPLQQANKLRDQQRQIVEIVNRMPGTRELVEAAGAVRVEAHVVELATGVYTDAIDPIEFDARRAAADPRRSIEIPPEQDLARIHRRARYGTVYILKKEGHIELIILPVYGKGYASTMYGFLALAGDGNTVMALDFYEHGETPGMGAEITDPQWQGRWHGKKVRDEQGRLRIGVAPGAVVSGGENAAYEVDGLSGATRTGRGVTNLLRFWLGEWGFGPYLDRISSS